MDEIKGFLNWAAGYFEAEGHASIQRTRSYQVVVHISNSDREPILLFYNTWRGGKWMERPTEYRGPDGNFKRGKPQFRVLYHWDTAGKVLRDLLPYIRTGIKRKAIETVLKAIQRQEEAANMGLSWGSGKTLEDLYKELKGMGFGR